LATKYYQVKLINDVDVEEGYTTECLIRFGQENDAKYLDEVMTMIPANSIAIMDRGYASWDFVNQMSDAELKFVVRIRNNMKTKFDHDKYRVLKFYDAQNSEYRLVANLTEFSDEEVAVIYSKRWQIELLWKFLKMHLKLDHFITKNLNGVKLQIYIVLIAYLILQLIEIPPFYGNKLLEKFRYIQMFLHRHCSLIHWSYDLFPELLF
jgi:putative transposase